MKTKYLLILLLVFSFSEALKAQKWSDLKLRAESNISKLDKNNSFGNGILFKPEGLTFYNYTAEGTRSANALFIKWENIPFLVRKLEKTRPYDISRSYVWSEELIKNLHLYPNLNEYKENPTSLKDLVIAIDPGHFAANFKEAVALEEKYVKVRGADVGQKGDLQIYEAELTDLTALILEKKLLDAGARPFVSKDKGTNSLNANFSYWYKHDFKRELVTAFNEQQIDKEQFDFILNGDSINVFRNFFKFLEFNKRVERINDSMPAATICIHYNAHEANKRDAEGFLKPVQQNYSMAFVPGAFLKNELSRPSEKVDFLRLLFSNDLDKSIRLANLILEKERNIAGISEVPSQNLILDERFCTPTAYEGVFCRNLAMTRMVHGPIVYLEALLQDNDREIVNLSVKDYEFTHPRYGKLKAPKRCEQVAESIFRGLADWVEENKIMASLK